MKRLETDLKARLKEKPILLMTHLMLGYPSFAANREVIAQMAANGVDCIELQIPFSEPIADGPVIARAGQASLNAGTKAEYLAVTRPKWDTAFEAMQKFASDCKNYVPKVMFTVVDVIPQAEIDAAQAVADSLGIPLRVRKYDS